MFDDRRHAGELLGTALSEYRKLDPVVYALVRGGLPVATPVAEQLDAPLDIVLVRKLGAPMQSELAIGAVADGGAPATVLHLDRIRDLGVSRDYIEQAECDALAELERRRDKFFQRHQPISPKGRAVILVDDGLATGATMEAAVKSMRLAGATQVFVAVPVAPLDAMERFRRLADGVVCLETPDPFWAVGNHYRSFPQLSDSDVVETLSDFDSRRADQRPTRNGEVR